MGMYDDITGWVRCSFCKKRFKAHLQTKDFARLLDHLEVGQDTRKLVKRWWLHDGSLFRGEGVYEKTLQKRKDNPIFTRNLPKLTREQCRPMKITEVRHRYRNKNKWSLHVNFFKHYKTGKRELSWSVYKYEGKSRTAFHGIKDTSFSCHGSCTGCGRWLECIGTIKDYIFTGLEINKPLTKENQKFYIRRKIKA